MEMLSQKTRAEQRKHIKQEEEDPSKFVQNKEREADQGREQTKKEIKKKWI